MPGEVDFSSPAQLKDVPGIGEARYMIGQFYDAEPEDIPSIMKQPVSAVELQKWPLKHGTYRAYDKNIEDMRISGLRADGGEPDERSPHSSNYDRALGRADYVFLAPADFRFSYGSGAGGFLVDPDVLAMEGTVCADQDIASAFECLEMAVDGDGEDYVGPAKEPQTLIRMAEELSANEAETVEARVLRVLQTEEFLSHYRLYYQDSVPILFSKIEASSRGESLFELFNRTNLGVD